MAEHAESRNLADASGEAGCDANVVADPLSVSQDVARFEKLGILDILLADRSTDGNIVWATTSYADCGEGFQPQDQISAERITGENIHLIRTRARKEALERAALTKAHAEVFTPTWVCRTMIDEADRAWRDDWLQSDRAKADMPEWQAYVESNRLEITCGEAPYLVNRYDASSGERVAPSERSGILSRKLSLVSVNTGNRKDWLRWAVRALQSTYGYELQGDNLLIARINVLASVEDFLADAGHGPLKKSEYKRLAEIISWNLWQMDGLTNCVPFGAPPPEAVQMSLLDMLSSEPEEGASEPARGWALVKNWKSHRVVEFRSIRRKGKSMKFDYIIGNPPYQEEQEGDNANYAPPVYNRFMDEAYEAADKVELITPARFLFDAGSTPKAWNRKMLSDPHLKVVEYAADCSAFFPQQDIKGGIAITYRDATRTFGAIGTFTAFSELASIHKKASCKEETESLSSIIQTQVRFDLDALYEDYPNLRSAIGNGGKDKRFRNNIFDKVPLFKEEGEEGTVKVLGIQKNKRVWKYIERRYVDFSHDSLNAWKVLVPRANGSGALGEVLSTPLIGQPLIGFTQSFISIGSFLSENEAQACMKYVKGKFARTLLGILKITQDNDRGVWRYVPLQDFTSNSDIDWSKSVAEIDQQLYRKYGLSDEEIEFIETHVKEMD
ncbi:Eco57I restriction-modification methylase domain-containing protein [Adlercreutzia sp. ZJ154]|uniref:Eco57I restriction-modification methylase domain-containing protein n=1 Tax=Adlercreutzia sp. ZJ154 TaxID=2709790 RepID=UPI00197FE219|nr:Eco57I restriction-modification methylase domain-containing protein [Adlercreutzia sp. ZJ154]